LKKRECEEANQQQKEEDVTGWSKTSAWLQPLFNYSSVILSPRPKSAFIMAFPKGMKTPNKGPSNPV